MSPARRAIEAHLHQQDYQQQLDRLRNSPGVNEEDVQDYQKTEILRASIAEVKSRARAQEQVRLSPRKYNAVKSKVAGNMKSQKQAKKVSAIKATHKASDHEMMLHVTSQYKSGSSPVRQSTSPGKFDARQSQIADKEAQINALVSQLTGSPWRERASTVVVSSSPVRQYVVEHEEEPRTLTLNQSPEPQLSGTVEFTESRAEKTKKVQSKAPIAAEEPVRLLEEDGPIDIQTRQTVTSSYKTTKTFSPSKRPGSASIKDSNVRKMKRPAAKAAKQPSFAGGGMMIGPDLHTATIPSSYTASSQIVRKVSPTKALKSPVKSVSKASVSYSGDVSYVSNLGDHKFRNVELEAKTAKIQAEFDALLNSSEPGKYSSPTRKSNVSQSLKMDEFYKVMGNFYSNEMKKHKSPTKRLIAQKNTAWEHKEIMSNNLHRTQNYGLTYVSSPQKSYVVEPKGGELNYELAYKNPLKFYDQVLNQDITQHKVAKSKTAAAEQEHKRQVARDEHRPVPKKKTVPLELKTKQTKRKIGRILYAVQNKLANLMLKKISDAGLSAEEVEVALNSTIVKNKVNQHLLAQNIQLVDEKQKPVFQRALSLLGEKGDRATNESPGGNDSFAMEPEQTDLQVTEGALQEVQHEVQNYIRRNSKLVK